MLKKLGVVLVLLLLAACGQQQRLPSNDRDTIVLAAAYDSLESLHRSAVRAGVPCPDWLVVPGSPIIGEETGTCSPSNVMTTYRNRFEIKQALAEKHRWVRMTGSEQVILIGPNWSIVDRTEVLEDIAPKLGGEVYYIEPQQ